MFYRRWLTGVHLSSHLTSALKAAVVLTKLSTILVCAYVRENSFKVGYIYLLYFWSRLLSTSSLVFHKNLLSKKQLRRRFHVTSGGLSLSSFHQVYLTSVWTTTIYRLPLSTQPPHQLATLSLGVLTFKCRHSVRLLTELWEHVDSEMILSPPLFQRFCNAAKSLVLKFTNTWMGQINRNPTPNLRLSGSVSSARWSLNKRYTIVSKPPDGCPPCR